MRWAASWVRRRLAGSSRWAAIRLLAGVSPGTTALLGVWALVNGLSSNVFRVAVGLMVAQVPAVVRDGLHSPAGHRMVWWFFASGTMFALSLVAEPAYEVLSSSIKARLTYSMQTRLMAAVSAPAGIAHLEDPEVLDRLTVAQGSLMTYEPGDAPCWLARVIGFRITGLVSCVVIGSYRWWLGVVMAVWWCATRPATMRTIEVQVKAFQSGTDTLRRARYFQQLATRPTAAKETRVFGLGDWVVDQYRVHWGAGMAESWVRRARMDRWVLATGLGGAAVSVLVAGVLGYDVLHGRATLTDIGIVLPSIASAHIVGGLGLYDFPVVWSTASLPVFERVEEQLRAKATETGSGTIDPAAMPHNGVRFEGVSFRYPGSSVDAMDGLDLTFEAGRSTAIVGANGAGKTTLIKLLAGLHAPTNGRIAVDGIDLADLRQADWQRRVAVVFQDFTRYPSSLADNIGFGAVEHLQDRAGVMAAASRVGVTEIADQLPSGWETVLSRQFTGGADLSGGQWQRIALARAVYAIANGATMLVLDEPTAWLDVRGEAAFYDRFLELTRGLTTVIISHRFSTVRQADTICVIDNGKVIERGNHDTLVAQGGTYAHMFSLQATRFNDIDSDDDPIGSPA